MNSTKIRRSASTTSLPAQIADILRLDIAEGRLAPGSMLPSRSRLAAQYGVALRTLEQAVKSLLEEGVLRAKDGCGTFVVGVSPVNSSPVPSVPPPLGFGVVGVIAYWDESDIWTSTVLKSLEEGLVREGGSVRYFNMLSGATVEEAVTALQEQGVGSFVFVSISERHDFIAQILSNVGLKRVPTVIVCWEPFRVPVPHVFYDNSFAGYQATEHLLHLGCTSLFLMEARGHDWSRQRREGFQESLRLGTGKPVESRVFVSDIEIVNDWSVVDLTSDAVAYFTELCSCVREAEGLVGVIAVNDRVAAQLMGFAGALGLRAGRDFALVGFDATSQSRELGLTTLRPPLEELATNAISLLMGRVNGDKTSGQIRLCSSLIPRTTTDHRHLRNALFD